MSSPGGLGGITTGVEAQRDGKLHEGIKLHCVCYRVLTVHVMCVLVLVLVRVQCHVSVRVIMCILEWVHVCVAPPTVVGTWSVAF